MLIDIKDLQKRIYQNKINKNFNVTDIPMEICHAQSELSEVFDAWRANPNNTEKIAEELADVAIFLFGIAEICNIDDLGEDILNKVNKNEQRSYINEDGIVYRIEPDGTKIKAYHE